MLVSSTRMFRRARIDRSLLATEPFLRRLNSASSQQIYIAIGVILLLVTISILLSAHTTEISYQITQVEAENSQLQAETQQLHYQAAALHTPEQVSAEAAGEGMTYPAASGYLQAYPAGLDLQAPIGAGPSPDSLEQFCSVLANWLFASFLVQPTRA